MYDTIYEDRSYLSIYRAYVKRWTAFMGIPKHCIWRFTLAHLKKHCKHKYRIYRTLSVTSLLPFTSNIIPSFPRQFTHASIQDLTPDLPSTHSPPSKPP